MDTLLDAVKNALRMIDGGTLDEAISVMKAKGCTQVWP